MSHKEYKANVSGLNIFFGAIIGMVMAEVKLSSAFTYSLLLLLVASFVIALIYISASKYRARNAIFSILALLLVWYKVYQGDSLMNGLDIEWLRQRLLPTFSARLFLISAAWLTQQQVVRLTLATIPSAPNTNSTRPPHAL